MAQWYFWFPALWDQTQINGLSFTSSLCIFSWRVWYVSAYCALCFNVSKHNKWFFIWFACLWCKFRLIQCRKKEEQKWTAIGGYICMHSSVLSFLTPHSHQFCRRDPLCGVKSQSAKSWPLISFCNFPQATLFPKSVEFYEKQYETISK